ncbi:MAG: von Willebrand factor type A domain-containing protein [Bacteroidetes bacterium]|nr:von Willebrand factor type A domain-containing protein [Bacteroidota bacterium]
MIKISFLSFLLASFIGIAQQTPGRVCSIYGKVTDKSSKEEIPFANILLYKNDTVKVAVATTDMIGDFCFKTVPDGTYKIKAVYVGYSPTIIQKIVVTNQKAAPVNIRLANDEGTKLDEVQVISYSQPVTDGDMKSGSTVTREEYHYMTTQKLNSVAVTTAGVHRKYKEKNAMRGGRAVVSTEYNTEEYGRIYDNEFKDSKKDPLSTFSIDVDKASYSNVRRFINQQQLPQPDAVRIEEMINYFSYNYPKPVNNQPFSITTEYTDCPWNKNHQLIHIGLQGKQIELDNLPSNNLVFLIDVSGSMESDDKLPLLKSGLRLLVEQMRPQDKVAIVVYAGAAGVVLPSTSGEHKEKIYDALDNLQAGGSTAGGEGILLAYKTAKENFLNKGNNRIILATDGDFNVGVSSDGELTRLIEKQREDGVFLSVLGFGTGNYKDSKMEQLADKGNGNYAYIDNLLEAKKVLVKEMGGTLLTIAKDVKLQIEFNPAKVKAYRLVGYENRLLNNEDFNDDKKDAGELGSGHTVTAIYEIIPAGSQELVASIDALKYQQMSAHSASENNEVMTIKFRYKEPKESTSQLISHIVLDKKTPCSAVTENCKFACAVAEFGMLLRDSKFKGDADFKQVISMAKEAKGKDDEGYRAEFIRLVEMAELLKK